MAAFNSVDQYPSDFLGVKIDGKVVHVVMDKKFPTYHSAADLPAATVSGSLLFPTPGNDQVLKPFHPNYLAMRFDQVIHDRAMTTLMKAWVDL